MVQDNKTKNRSEETKGNGQKKEGAQSGRTQSAQRSSSESMTPRGSRGGGGLSRYQSSPFALMSQLSQEMDRVFEDFWGTPLGQTTPYRRNAGENSQLASQLWAPALEVHQHGDEVVVRADLPGLSKEDVRVEVEDQTLTIQGERRQDCENEDGEGNYMSECRYGSFYRSIPLPKGVNPDDVKAEFSDGVLEVRMHAPARETSRKSIEVQSRNR